MNRFVLKNRVRTKCSIFIIVRSEIAMAEEQIPSDSFRNVGQAADATGNGPSGP